MQLTQFTDYSLRALIFIATQHETVTINEIAAAYDIKKNHLTKIIHNLAKLGMVKTLRGKNGGIALACPAESLNLKEIIAQLESHFDLVPCFNREKQNCCIAPVCRLKGILHDAMHAFLDVLAQYTLADIVQNRLALNAILRDD